MARDDARTFLAGPINNRHSIDPNLLASEV